MGEVNPIFKWTGGKNRLREQYGDKFFPEEKPSRYVDLFAGSLANAIWVKERWPDVPILVNDYNEELMELYSILKSNGSDVMEVWDAHVNVFLPLDKAARKSLYYEWRKAYTLDHESYSKIWLAATLLLMLQTNFNGMWKRYIKCNSSLLHATRDTDAGFKVL